MKGIKRQYYITGSLIVILNLGAFFFLLYQMQRQRENYLTLRSEDGFMLLESLAHLIQESLEGTAGAKTLPSSTFAHLDHLSNYEDLEFLSLETNTEIIYRSKDSPLANTLKPVWEDPEMMASLYEGEPFARDLHVGDTVVLEYNWPIFDGPVFWGMLRIGLSMKIIQVLEKNFNQHMVLFMVFILLLDGVVLYALFLSKRLGWEELKLQTILDHIQDGVHIVRNDESVFANKPFKNICGPEWQTLHESLQRDYETREIGGRSVLLLRNRFEQASILVAKDISLENIAEETRVRERRMLSVGELSSAFAHEIRNPLNTISMLIQQIMLAGSDRVSSQDANLKIILSEINRLNNSVVEFINISKLPTLQREEYSLDTFFRNISDFYSARFKSNGLVLNILPAKEIGTLLLDRNKLKGVFINLIDNALDAHATKIDIVAIKENQMARIIIQDNGEGMDTRTQERAFELYFTTKSSGSGLGLPHVQRIISAHGGFIKLNSSPERGTQITVYLPAERCEDREDS